MDANLPIKICLLVNTGSRRGQECYELARNFYEKNAGVELLAFRAVTDGTTLTDIAAQLIAMNPDRLVVGSGDGTISEVIDLLVGHQTALAIIPLGTTNNFSRTLGIPLDPLEALNVSINADPAAIDLARVGHDYFANVASIGLSSRIAASVSPQLKRVIGRAAYAVAGLRELLTHRAFDCEVAADGKIIKFSTHQLVIANGRYHSGTKINNDVSIRNGKLLLLSFDSGNRLRLLINFIRYNASGTKALRGNQILMASSIALTTTPQRRLEIDGELKVRTPVTIECVAGAVNVVVPDSSSI